MVLRATLAGGRRVGAATAAGIFVGVLAWGVAAAVGVSALLATWVLRYTVLRYAGAGIPAGPGVPVAAGGLAVTTPTPAADPPALALTPARGFRQGSSRTCSTRKVSCLLCRRGAALPPRRGVAARDGRAARAGPRPEGLVWFAAIILGAHRARRLLAGCRARQAVDATAGTALVAFGLRLGAP